MANLVKLGQFYGIGGLNLTLLASMFLKDDDFAVPSDIRVATSGTFTNCARVSKYVLSLTNPSADGTFVCQVEYTEDDLTWYNTEITGVLLRSLGGININTTLVRNALSEDTNRLSELCTSPNVNPYSFYGPDGIAPHGLGEFRWYTHGAIGGTYVSHIAPTEVVAWGDDITIRGLASRIFKEISGKPYSQSKVSIYEGSTFRAETVVDFTTTHGAYVEYTVYNGHPNSQTTTTWTVKTEHYYGGVWVEGSSDTFTVTQAGKPYDISVNSGYPVRELDSASIFFDFAGPVSLIRFSVQIGGTWYYVEADFDDGWALELVYTYESNIPAGSAWRLQIEYPDQSNTFYTEASGTL